MRLGVLVAILVGACVGTDTTVCGDAICPAGTSCATVTTEMGAAQTRCVQPAQLAACADLDDGVACSLAGVASATCIGGACFPDACGDGLRGAVEACDDANITSGDGCASDCRSAEVCGNGIVDPVVLVEGVPAANELCDDGNFLAHDGCGRCATETPRWSLVPHLPPDVRAYHAMAADSRRHEVVMFGGADANYVTPNERWIWNGESWSAHVSDISPPGRVGTAMAYDSARDRLIVFGGSEPSFSVPTRDLWEWDGTRWEERGAAGPRARMEHAMAYDSIREQTILVGGLGYGATSFDYLDETWLWDGTKWRLHQPASLAETIPARSRSGLAFDPVRGETVLFGGSNGLGLSNETWLFDGARWRRVTTTQAPSGRFAPAMAWDPTSRRVILFGGLGGTTMADAWAWDGTSWTPLPGGPPARFSGAMSSDFERGGVVLYGGADSTPSARDTWWWDGTAWHDETRVYVPDLAFAGVATDLARDVIVAFGGRIGSPTIDTTREYVRGSWYERPLATRPAPRQLQQMVYMPSIGKIVMWAGTTANGTPVNDGTWAWDGTAWQRLALAANTPTRVEVASTFDAERREIVMFGGRASALVPHTDETWVFDGATWTQRTPATLPPARGSASLGYDPIRRRVVMTAGQIPGDFAFDLWTWDGTNWTEHPQPTRPTARVDGSLIWSSYRKRLVFAGGEDSASAVADDVWELDDTTWSRVNATAPPRVRNAMTATTGGIMRISASGVTGTMWRLRWESDAADEVCSSEIDLDGDTLVGCADPDCDNRCASCGDGSCSLVEDCHLCPMDCGVCAERCGDATCDPSESAASCPGDC